MPVGCRIGVAEGDEMGDGVRVGVGDGELDDVHEATRTPSKITEARTLNLNIMINASFSSLINNYILRHNRLPASPETALSLVYFNST